MQAYISESLSRRTIFSGQSYLTAIRRHRKEFPLLQLHLELLIAAMASQIQIYRSTTVMGRQSRIELHIHRLAFLQDALISAVSHREALQIQQTRTGILDSILYFWSSGIQEQCNGFVYRLHFQIRASLF